MWDNVVNVTPKRQSPDEWTRNIDSLLPTTLTAFLFIDHILHMATFLFSAWPHHAGRNLGGQQSVFQHDALAVAACQVRGQAQAKP